MQKKKLKKIIILFTKIIIGVVSILYLLKSGYLNKETFSNFFLLRNLPIIIFSACLFILSQILVCFRLKIFLKMINYSISFFKSLKIILIGSFFNFIIPGSIGGDIVKSYYLEKDFMENKGISSGVVLIDRLIGILGLAILAFISITYLILYKKIFVIDNQDLFWIPLLIFIFFIMIITLILLSNNEKIRKSIKKVSEFFFKKNFIYYIIYGFGIILKDKKRLLLTLIISVVLHFISIIGLINLVNIFTETSINEFFLLFTVSSIILLLGIIPISPGNIGWIELAGAVGWSMIGAQEGANVFLFWRILVIVCSLPGIFLYFIEGIKIKKINLMLKD